MELKRKYRDSANIPVVKNGAYKSRTGNSRGPTPKKPQGAQGTGPRRRRK